MKKVEAYQTSDGKKFFKKKEARKHEGDLRYRVKIQREAARVWENRKHDFCQVCICHFCDGPYAGDNCFRYFVDPTRCNNCGPYLRNWSMEECLSAGQYVREADSPNKNRPGDEKIDKIIDILTKCGRDISDLGCTLRSIAEKTLKVVNLSPK